jgi:acetyl-CoA acetyltransferase family protein
MGEGCERIAHSFNITRESSDLFALKSHQRAAEAVKKGYFDNLIIPVTMPPNFKVIGRDDGIRGETSIEKMAKLTPVFDKKFGINTAANSSGLSDGASAVLLMDLAKSKSEGIKPLAKIISYVYAGGDPLDEPLLGPALAIPKLLSQHNLKAKDIGVWEIHEAFAAQVLANLKAMASKKFITTRLSLDQTIEDIDPDSINSWGGSISLGHPFGATGGRLLITAAERLVKEDKQFAIVSACAAGGLGTAMLLENCR